METSLVMTSPSFSWNNTTEDHNMSFNNTPDTIGQMDTGNHDNDTFVSQDMAFVHRITNPFAMTLSTTTVAFHIPLLIVLSRCRKMPSSLRLLSINFVCCSFMYQLSIAIMTFCFIFVETAYTQTFYDFRIMFVTALYAVSANATAGLAIERYIRVTRPFAAKTFLKKRYIRAYIILAWMFSFLVPTSVTLYQVTINCDFVLIPCDLSYPLYINAVFFFCLFMTVSPLICFSCYRISHVINSLQVKDLKLSPAQPNIATIDINASMGTCSEPTNSNTEAVKSSPSKNFQSSNETCSKPTDNIKEATKILPNKNFHSTRYIMKIMMSYVIIHTPITIHAIIFILFPEWKSPQLASLFHVISYTSTFIIFFITQHFYIWKFKECKLIFLLMFCSRNEGYRDKILELKIDVYDIQTVARKGTSTRGP